MSVSMRYWRIQATGDAWHSNSPKWIIAYRIMGFESVDAAGTDVFQGKTASASSIYSASWPASRAVDGDDATWWGSKQSPADYQWFEVDLAAAAIRSLSVLAYHDNNGRRWPRTFDVLASADGTTWTTVASLSSVNVSGTETWTDIQAGGVSGIARPLIDGWGHGRHIDSRVMIR